MNRIRSTLHNDLSKSKLAASILLTLPGSVYIYYGEEIGMLGVKPDQNLREPFLWGDENFKDTSWMQPVHSIPGAVEPASKQMNDPASIYHHYKTWIKIRKEHPAIAFGSPEFIQTEHQQLLVYRISSGSEKILVLHNIGNIPVEFTVPENSKVINEGIILNENKIKIDGVSSVMLELN
jgi:glycosidase